MDIDVNVSMTYGDGQIGLDHSLNNLGAQDIAVCSFDFVFPDGGTLDVVREDAPQPDLSGFATDLLAGAPVWLRARVGYGVGETRSGYLIKDFCKQRDDGDDVVAVACKMREQEAMGMVAYWSQDFQTAARHFDVALSVYESEECAFSMRIMMQTYAYVLLTMGRVEEAGFHIRSALEMGDDRKTTRTRLYLLGNLANVQLKQNQAHAARATFEHVLEAATELSVRSSIGLAEAGIGSSYKLQGDREEAEKWLRRAIATARTDGDRLGLARRLTTLGFMLKDMGQDEGASASLAESLSVAMDIGDFQNVEEMCSCLWAACQAIDNPTPFVTTCERLLDVLPEHLAVATRVHILNSLAVVHSKRSQHARAIERCEHALAIARHTGDKILEAVLLINLGGNYARTGRCAEAQESFRESMRIAAEAGAWALVNTSKESLARVIAECEEEPGDEKAQKEYTEMLADWWFSQSPSDKATEE